MDDWILKRYGIKVEHLCARNKDGTKRTYEQLFYHVPKRRSQIVQVERERERDGTGGIGANKRVPGSGDPVVPVRLKETSEGRIKGFPGITCVNWCQKLKLRVFSDSPEPQRAQKNIVDYLGIAADEPKRFGQLSDKKRAPLVEFGIDEGLCGLYCQYNGILSPSYETSCRDGCWFCHNQGVDQLRHLRKNYPDYWELLLKWDLDSPTTFKADGRTVHDYDARFALEDEGLVLPTEKWRWSMLNEELNMRLF
jgi:hypothetical protein